MRNESRSLAGLPRGGASGWHRQSAVTCGCAQTGDLLEIYAFYSGYDFGLTRK